MLARQIELTHRRTPRGICRRTHHDYLCFATELGDPENNIADTNFIRHTEVDTLVMKMKP
jgi:hypothetical protein